MFSYMELRMIRYSIKRTMDDLAERIELLDPESDYAIEITSEIMLYQKILDKIAEDKVV